MKFISHRGNINGREWERENRMDYIYEALEKGFDVEIDVWYSDNQWWLGHDEPLYKTGTSIFKNKKIWVHVKNPHAFQKIKEIKPCHYFWHDGDDYALTSKGIVWCHKDAIILPDSVAVLPESDDWYKSELQQCSGICSDVIEHFRQEICTN